MNQQPRHFPLIVYRTCTRCGKTVVLAWNDVTTKTCPCGGVLEMPPVSGPKE